MSRLSCPQTHNHNIISSHSQDQPPPAEAMPPNTPTKRAYVRIIPNDSPPSLWSSISKLRMEDEDSETSSLTGSDTTINPPKKPHSPPPTTTPTIQIQLPHISSLETEARAFPQTHHTPLFHMLDTSYTGFKIVTPKCPTQENGMKISLFNDYANTSSCYTMPLLSPPTSPYNEPQNLSPYYRIPLLEEPVSTLYEDDRYEYLHSLENQPFKQVSDAQEDSDPEDEDWGTEEQKHERVKERSTLMPIRAMSPWNSLLLYLWSKGLSPEFIGTELGNLDSNILDEKATRRYVRSTKQGQWAYVPPHWKMDDEVARRTVEKFMKEQESWEDGSEKGVWLLRRWRGRDVEKAVRGVVKGYLWLRIKGVWEESK